MPFDEQLASRIRSLVARRKGFSEKKMFGGVGFLLNDKMCIGVWKEYLILRIGPHKYQKAIVESNVKEFDITGKVMRGWVMVEPAGIMDEASLKAWINRAVTFVRTLPMKER